MSAAAEKWARAQSLPQTEKSVLMVMARAHSPRWGYSNISQAKIAEEIGVTRETVSRTVIKLTKKGLIAVGTLPRKRGQWDRRCYILAPLDGGIKAPQKRQHRVTQDHTAPCDAHQTRHRVTQDHTSRRDVAPLGERSSVVRFRKNANGGAR